MRLPSLLLLCACTSTPSAPPAPLDQPGGAPVLALDQLPRQATLPPGRPAEALPGTFVLEDWSLATSRFARRFGATHAAPLPFDAGPEAERHAPLGLRVEVDGRALPWLFGRGERGWRIHDGQLLLVWPDPRPPERVVVHHPRLTRRLARLQPAASGLAPDAFVRHAHAIGEETREGLLLPAPGRLAWRLTLPPGATLRTATAMVDDGLRDVPGDGATLRVEVTADGETTAVDARAVPAQTEAFTDWTVDLSAWGGREVTLALVADPGATDTHDRPFLAHPVVVGTTPDPDPRRVLWIGLDTTRPDHLGLYGYARPTTPALDAWARTATVFDDAVAPAPRTRPSFRTALTGRRPLDGVGAPTFLSVLDQAGFATGGIVANVHLTPRFGFSAGSDRWLLDPSADAELQVDRALEWLGAHRDRDAALFLHLMDPHLRYDAPGDDRERFVTDPDPDLPASFNRSQVLRWMRDGRLDDRRKAHIEALYDGEIRYMDRHLGRLLQAVEALPGRTLVVLQSDHGEEFWEHGGFEHNHTLKPEVVDAVMAVRTPGQAEGARVEVPVTLADLVPTVLDLLAVPGPPTDGRSLQPLLADPDGTAWTPRPLGVAHLMYDTERWAVRHAGHTYVLHTGSGLEELYDRTADPDEHTDRSEGADLTGHRAALAEAHGIDVGPGWRARVSLSDAPVTWTLPAPARSAGILDPEAFRPRRANEVWGETPPVRPDDVATVTLSEDRRTLTLTPGAHAQGTLYVRFDGPVPPGGTITVGGVTSEVQPGPNPPRPGLFTLDVREGTVLVPPVGEAERLAAALGVPEAVPADTRSLLQELGYLDEAGDDAP